MPTMLQLLVSELQFLKLTNCSALGLSNSESGFHWQAFLKNTTPLAKESFLSCQKSVEDKESNTRFSSKPVDPLIKLA